MQPEGLSSALAELRQAGVSSSDLSRVSSMSVGQTLSGTTSSGVEWSVTRQEHGFSIQSGK